MSYRTEAKIRAKPRRFCALLATIALAGTGALSACEYIEDFPTEDRPSASAPEDPIPTEGDSSHPGGEEADAAESLYNDLGMNESQARTTLEVLPIEEPAPMSGYSRDDYPHWLSANEWGWTDVPDASDCDAREAALARDGVDVVSDPDTCRADAGAWIDPYSGEEIIESSDVDIDHVVPLAAAHRAGADTWNEEQRSIYANSPLVLTASGATTNREKGDKGPEAWKPENRDAWCPYSLRWIAVKNEFGLHLTSEEEREALEEMLDTCGEGSV